MKTALATCRIPTALRCAEYRPELRELWAAALEILFEAVKKFPVDSENHVWSHICVYLDSAPHLPVQVSKQINVCSMIHVFVVATVRSSPAADWHRCRCTHTNGIAGCTCIALEGGPQTTSVMNAGCTDKYKTRHGVVSRAGRNISEICTMLVYVLSAALKQT